MVVSGRLLCFMLLCCYGGESGGEIVEDRQFFPDPLVLCAVVSMEMEGGLALPSPFFSG